MRKKKDEPTIPKTETVYLIKLGNMYLKYLSTDSNYPENNFIYNLEFSASPKHAIEFTNQDKATSIMSIISKAFNDSTNLTLEEFTKDIDEG